LKDAQLGPRGSRVGDVVRHGIVAVDARRRGFRRRDTVESRVRALIRAAVDDVEAQSGVRLETVLQPPLIRGRVRTLLGSNGTPLAAVANVFQAQTGARADGRSPSRGRSEVDRGPNSRRNASRPKRRNRSEKRFEEMPPARIELAHAV
jgi:hypothetical protein